MQVVAKIQISAEREQRDIANEAQVILDRWAARKFERGADGAARIRAGGSEAQWDQTRDEVAEERLDRLCTLEPVPGGNLQLDVDILTRPDRLAVRCVLRVGSDSGIAPTDVAVRAPRFVREIVGLPCRWTVGAGGERVFAQPFFVEADELPVLEELMGSPVRRLPIVIVSEHDGETLAGDLHERLAHDLCGLAHVVRLSSDASWALTRSRGKEWSCFNGAVRLLWPLRARLDDPRAHPLWTYDQLGARFANEPEAREHLRAVLARRVLNASTYVADDPGFGTFAAAQAAAKADHARAAATEGGDFRALADVYADENDRLRAEGERHRATIDDLRQQIEALEARLRSSTVDTDDSAEREPPETVMEAVATARRELAGRVTIAAETDADIAELKPVAGPPEKILRYLLSLGDLADALTKGPIGDAVPVWLKKRNVECSVDSETAKASEKGRRFRQRKVNGVTVDCIFHLKPADRVRPDMCARIYFATSPVAPHVQVGYIGRHMD